MPTEPKPKTEDISVEFTVAPTFVKGLETQEAPEGVDVEFTVIVDGQPTPEVTW